MNNQELINRLSRLPRTKEVYVYDERRDIEREITDVGEANDLMAEGIVISIRGVQSRNDDGHAG